MQVGFFIMAFCILVGCQNKSEAGTTIQLNLSPGNHLIYLEKLPYSGEKIAVVDSLRMKPSVDKYEFFIPHQEEGIFQFRIMDKVAYFINENAKMSIFWGDFETEKYYFKNAPVNHQLRSFLDSQRVLINYINDLVLQQQKSKELFGDTDVERIKKNIDSIKATIHKRDVAFIMRTESPGIFLFLYNRIDFTDKPALLKEVINRADIFFSKHTAVNRLISEAKKYFRILDEEINIGDIIPDIQLPDQRSRTFSLQSLRGKYVLIDLWSTWCGHCLSPTEKNTLKEELPSEKFELLSIAIDAEEEDWKRSIDQNHIKGMHMIDRKMWDGPTVQNLKFDSIPYNYLISPSGVVLDKAIPPGQLLKRIKQQIK